MQRSTLCGVEIVNQTNLPMEAFAKLNSELSAIGTLLQVVTWGRRQQPPVLLLETVAQDEYTHDVIAGTLDESTELFFVFGST